MPKHKMTWIVLADGSRAVIVKRREIGPGFDVVAQLASQQAHIRPTSSIRTARARGAGKRQSPPRTTRSSRASDSA